MALQSPFSFEYVEADCHIISVSVVFVTKKCMLLGISAMSGVIHLTLFISCQSLHPLLSSRLCIRSPTYLTVSVDPETSSRDHCQLCQAVSVSMGICCVSVCVCVFESLYLEPLCLAKDLSGSTVILF